jgi:hypothetical protein
MKWCVLQSQQEMLPECKTRWGGVRTRAFGGPLIEKICFRNWSRVLGQIWGETG